MEPSSWPSDLTLRVARALRDARKAAGMTMGGLAAACAERGFPDITEQALKNLESGRRSTLPLADFFVLADVVEVPPILLLFPLSTTAEIEVLPGRPTHTWEALTRFTGESVNAAGAGSTNQAVLDTYRAHDDILRASLTSAEMATQRRRAADTALDAERLPALRRQADAYEQLAFEDRTELRAYRERMRAQGLTPPPLPQLLSFVDSPSTTSREDLR